MTSFVDSSALVKRYADEDGTALVRRLEAPLVVSALSRVEITSALWRQHREGQLPLEEVGLLLAELQADWAGVPGSPVGVVIPVTAAVLARASDALAFHRLRAGDAVQLATALLARMIDPQIATFVTFDGRLAAAAAVEGFAVRGAR